MSKLFPELEGAAPLQPVQAAAPPLSAAPKPLSRDTVIVGGKWSNEKFDQLLGLPGPFTAEGGCHVRMAKAFSDGRLELEIMGGGVSKRLVWFFPKGSMMAYAVGDQFEIGCEGEADDSLRMIMGQAAQRLKDVSLQALRKVIFVDPQKQAQKPAPAPAAPAGSPSGPDKDREPKDMLKSLVQSYGSSESWHNFFADKEQQRNFCHNFAGSVVTIGHEDLECHYATPKMGDGTVSFFNYPRVHEQHNPDRQDPAAGEEGPAKDLDNSYLISDLQDMDIIRGGAKKLDRLLDGVAQREHKPELVIMRATCVPIVIGDDMEGSVDKFREKSDIPIIYLDNLADQYATPFRETFSQIKESPEFKNPEKRPGSVNLVGFPKLTEMSALIEFLRELDISINCRMLPEIDIKVMKRYRAAELSVLFDTELYQKTYDEVIGGIDLKTINPPAPYGIAGTRRWLSAVAAAVGRQQRFNEVWERYYSGVGEQWERLKKDTVGNRLGFVVDAERIKMLTEPRKMTGVPIVACLKEMGFELEFLYYTAGAQAPKDVKITEEPERNKMLFFNTPDELEELLEASSAQAFYSEVYFDRRLTRCGKSQFSVNMFEMGFGGAVRTLQRLLSVCRLPFYRKYGAFLGPAFPAA